MLDKILDFFRNSISLLNFPFLVSLSSNFSIICSHMLSKFEDKSTQKSSVFTNKTSCEKTLLFKATPMTYSQLLQSKESIDSDFFKRSISFHYQHVYATKKWQNWFYRFIFFGLSLLFLILGTIIFFKTINFACGIYFKNGLLVKNGINLLCLLLAGGAFGVGYRMHPEKEAIQYLFGKVDRELSHPAKDIQIEFNAIISNLSHEFTPPKQTFWIKKTLNSIH